MKSAIGRRVGVLTAVVLSTFGLGQAGAGAHATAPTAQAPGTQQASGRLMVAHGDDFSGHNVIMSAEVRTRTGVIPLQVSAAQHSAVMALAGRDVVVTGRPTSAGLSADSVRATGPAATPSTRRIAVVLLRYQNSAVEDITAAEANTLFFGATGSVKKWFNEVSGGAVTVTGQVFGWYPSNMATTDCTDGGAMLNAWLAEGAMRAAADGYLASNFDNLVIHTPEFSGAGCGFAGIAWVGQNGVMLKGSVSNNVGVASHELGHNMGLWHSGSMDCHGVTIAASCSVIDYGDPYDVMGDAYGGHHYNGAHKYKLGWMAPSQVRTVSSGMQTIALTASEQPAAGTTQLIILPRTATSSYAVERRASFGDFDQGLSGVWVRILTTINSDDMVLLDMKPLTPAVDDGSMTVGQTFNDTVNHVSIKLLSDSGPAASVKVCVGICGNPPPATHTTYNCNIASPNNGRFVVAELGYTGTSRGMLRARSTAVAAWEKFQCVALPGDLWAIKSRTSGQYVTNEYTYASPNTGMLRVRPYTIGPWEKFKIAPAAGCACFTLQSPANGRYATAELNYKGASAAMLRARATSVSAWEKFVVFTDPS